MDVLKPLINEGLVEVYTDDVIIPAKDMDEAMRRLERVLEVMEKFT